MTEEDKVELAIAKMLLRDYKILVRVRRGVLYSVRATFEEALRCLWAGRCTVEGACFEDLLVLYYTPGDYELAANLVGVQLPP